MQVAKPNNIDPLDEIFEELGATTVSLLLSALQNGEGNDTDMAAAWAKAKAAIKLLMVQERLEELKSILDMGEKLYFPYGHSDDILKARISQLNSSRKPV